MTMENRFRLLLAFNTLLLLALLGIFVQSCRTARAGTNQPSVLKVSELDVVDPHGVIRARIGGDLPDAVINGKRVPRGDKAAGVLLYDDIGQERSGYVTFSTSRVVALTLDNRDRAGQTAIFAAGPSGGSKLMLSYGNDVAEMQVDHETGPSIHVMRANQVVFHVPPPLAGFEKTEACSESRGALAKYSREQVLTWCRSHFPEEACQACLAAP